MGDGVVGGWWSPAAGRWKKGTRYRSRETGTDACAPRAAGISGRPREAAASCGDPRSGAGPASLRARVVHRRASLPGVDGLRHPNPCDPLPCVPHDPPRPVVAGRGIDRHLLQSRASACPRPRGSLSNLQTARPPHAAATSARCRAHLSVAWPRTSRQGPEASRNDPACPTPTSTCRALPAC